MIGVAPPGWSSDAASTEPPRTHAEARRLACVAFEEALRRGELPFTLADVRRELRGKDLACYCPLPEPGDTCERCHADVLLRIANGTDEL